MSQKTVLVVDDEPLIADLVAASLSEYDFRVVIAGSGTEAVRFIESGPELDALVTDIRMPGGISGWEVARRARTRLPWIPVVYITGHAENDWGSEGVPGSQLIPKPFSPEHVARRVQVLVQQA